MKFTMEVLEQTEEGLFTRVLDDEGQQVCIADGDNPYDSIRNACLVLIDIMEFASNKENEAIQTIIKERIEI